MLGHEGEFVHLADPSPPQRSAVPKAMRQGVVPQLCRRSGRVFGQSGIVGRCERLGRERLADYAATLLGYSKFACDEARHLDATI
jgi:hypothetical protein